MANHKITYIISEIDKSVFFEDTLMALKNNGNEVSCILINSQDGILHKFLLSNNFIIKTITIRKLIKSFPAVLECKKYLQKIKPDIIHCHLSTANTVGLIAGFLAGIKERVYTRHSGTPINSSKKEKILDRLHNTLATKVVAITLNTKNILLQQGVKKNKIFLLHHGFNIARMSNPDEKEVARIKNTYNYKDQYPVIGIVARWIDLKGIQYILPAFERLLLQYKNAKLCLFNANENAPYAEKILQLLNKLPSENYIIVPFEYNVYDMYHLFDIYIHTPVNSTCEAFGQTYVESLAAGIPGIFTLSGVAPEFIINEENALVVNFKNSDDIFHSLIRLLNDNDFKNKLVANGKKDVQKYFSWGSYVDALENLYE
jgi:glycosyltransferase involved in cell wall biosynthesis